MSPDQERRSRAAHTGAYDLAHRGRRARLTACGGGSDEGTGSTTVRVTLANHVWTENIKQALPEFEQQTGLKVELTQLGEDQLSDQYNVKLNAGSGDLDVMMYRPLQEGRLFATNGYLADLTSQCPGRSDGTFSDFQRVRSTPPATRARSSACRSSPSRRSSTTARICCQAGLTGPPDTLDELKAAAAKIQASNPGVAGFVARTGKSAAVTQFSSFLYSFGGDFVDGSGKATVNSDAAKQAYAFYGGLIREHGPANVSTDMSWPEAMAIFTQGKAAFYTEANSLYKNATDPTKSKVSDTVGFAPFPGRTGGIQTVQRALVGARHQRGLDQHGQRLEVRRVGDRQGTDAGPAEGRSPGRPDFGLVQPGRHVDLPGGPRRRHRGQHAERRGS